MNPAHLLAWARPKCSGTGGSAKTLVPDSKVEGHYSMSLAKQ